MKSAGLVVITSVILAFGLTIGGGYVTIDNLIHPQGNLFEGIVLSSMGIIVFLLLAMASTLGRTIQTFTEVYTQQLEMQKTMRDFYAKTASRPKSIGDILGGLGSNMTITNLDTGETTNRPISEDDPLKSINDMLMNSFKAASGKSGPRDPGNTKDMNREQLEKELAKAVKKDDYEKAKEIKELLQNLNDKPGDSEENQD